MAQRLAQLTLLAARCSAAASLSQQPGVLSAAAARLLGAAGQRHCARQLHASLPAAWGEQQQPADPEVQRKALINRMLYRSRQRGFLELDLLIGMWAEREVPHMSTDLIREFEVVLDQENPDMFKWLTGQALPPEELQQNRAFQKLQQHVKAMTDQHHSVPRAAGEAPKEWVRGWTDSGRDLSLEGSSSGTGVKPTSD